MTIEQIMMLLSGLHERVAALERVHAGHPPTVVGAAVPCRPHGLGATGRRRLRPLPRKGCLGASARRAKTAHSQVPEAYCTLTQKGKEP